MKRIFAGVCALACAVAFPTLSSAASTGYAVMARAATVGKVTAFDGSSLTIQTPGRSSGVVNGLVGAANAVTRADYPYVWGGGHGQAGVASIGSPGPGYSGHTVGYDCSGSVAAVLAGGGLWPAGSGVPNDAGIISTLRAEGLIVPGVGTGSVSVTLYDDPGIHIFMNIDGHFFGTSDGRGGNPSQRRGGAGWLNDGAPDASSGAFRAYHFIASALRAGTGSSHSLTFQVGQLTGPLSGFVAGERVKVSYAEVSTGSMFATSITLLGATTTGGNVISVGAKRKSFVLQTVAGKRLTLRVTKAVARGLQPGDGVALTYTTNGKAKIVRALRVTSTPGAVNAGGSSPSSSAPASGSGGSAGGSGSSGAGGSSGSSGSGGSSGGDGSSGDGSNGSSGNDGTGSGGDGGGYVGYGDGGPGGNGGGGGYGGGGGGDGGNGGGGYGGQGVQFGG